MGRGIALLLFVLFFGAIGAGARYGFDLLSVPSVSDETEHTRQDPRSVQVPPQKGTARASGLVAPATNPVAPSGIPSLEGFAPQDHYPLSRWTIDNGMAGEVQQAYLAGPTPAPLGTRPLSPQDVLLISGWAGDSLLGLRFPYVLFSLCGQIVGAARVDQPRPDVVRYIHPNLRRSGWTARLPVALLPRCLATTLEVWAAGPSGYLYPVQGRVPLPSLPLQTPDSTDLSGAPVITPDSLPPLKRKILQVTTDGANLRRCPKLSCDVVDVLSKGSAPGAVLDRSPPWTLVIADGKAGWIADGIYQWQPAESEDTGKTELAPPPPKPTPDDSSHAMETTRPVGDVLDSLEMRPHISR